MAAAPKHASYAPSGGVAGTSVALGQPKRNGGQAQQHLHERAREAAPLLGIPQTSDGWRSVAAADRAQVGPGTRAVAAWQASKRHDIENG